MAISRRLSRSLAILIVGISIILAFYRNPEKPLNRVNLENAQDVFDEHVSQYHKSYKFAVLIDSTNITLPNLEEEYSILFKEEKGTYKNYVIESSMVKTNTLIKTLQEFGNVDNYVEAVINPIPQKRAQTLERLREKFKEHEDYRKSYKNLLSSSKYGLDRYRQLIKEEDAKIDSLQKRIDDLDEGSYDIVMVTYTTKPAKSVDAKVRITRIVTNTIFNIAFLSIVTLIIFYGGKLIQYFLDWFGVGSKSKGYNYKGYYNGYYSRYGRDSHKKGKRKVKRIYKDKMTTDPNENEADEDSEN
ncbi:MAG: hypothetical protein JXR56_07640 [Candidatus Cloacimonetes bacterium]|nr:hypothetical protein [Candidatus Cloacimonadota bacterium]